MTDPDPPSTPAVAALGCIGIVAELASWIVPIAIGVALWRWWVTK